METKEEEEIAAIDLELEEIEAKLTTLKDRKDILQNRREAVKQAMLRKKSELLAIRDWSSTKFPWSNKVFALLKDFFNLTEFRPMQLEAINATLANEDTILIMPTGSGKSLCYQLPALINDGITVVVSPLVSLMEDQIMALKKINYPALMLSAHSSKSDLKSVANALSDPSSKIKLIYVSPEKIARNTRFLNLLEKCSNQGRFSRLAIDEVHCCSMWGHDFRPAYNFLGFLKDLFPKTPVLGLTATSTSKVTTDVQKMLKIRSSLVLKGSFNRPNLFYKVVSKPASQDKCLDLLEDWLKNKFCNQTGIIYTTTVTDCEGLAKELKKRDLKVGVYHAMLSPEVRVNMHSKWMDGSLQAIVATIAFGLGIDKPDVRFVIHHSLSKSMENFYQESGRAGRDGKRSECIVLFRLADVFKLSTMVFANKNGLQNLYGMVNYCLDSQSCRRSLIAEHFDEVLGSESCNSMCDHCESPESVTEFDAIEHCRSLLKIIHHATDIDVKLTAIKLLDAWYCKGGSKLRIPDVKRPPFDRITAEKIVGYLLIKGYLKEDFHFTAYSAISYLRRGPTCELLDDQDHKIILHFPIDSVTSQNSLKKSKTTSPKGTSVEPERITRSKKRLSSVDVSNALFDANDPDEDINVISVKSKSPSKKSRKTSEPGS